jgi:hypothetical protein
VFHGTRRGGFSLHQISRAFGRAICYALSAIVRSIFENLLSGGQRFRIGTRRKWH